MTPSPEGADTGAGSGAGSALAELLTLLRHRARLTQEELAERAEVTSRAISDLERGVARRPRRDTVDRLVAALGLTAADAGRLWSAARGDPAEPPGPAQLPRTVADFVDRPQLATAVVDRMGRDGGAGAPALCCLWGRPG